MENNIKNPINVNSAEVAELSVVPGLGSVLAARIIEGRPYETLDDLTNVPGIGSQSLENLKPLLTTTDPEEDLPVTLEPVQELKKITAPAEEKKSDLEPAEPVEQPEPIREEETEETAPDVLEAEQQHVAVGEESHSVFYPIEDEEEPAFVPEKRAVPEEDERAIQVIEQKKERAADTQPQAKRLRRREIAAWIAGSSLISILLSILIILGIFGLVNGSLRYLTASQGTREINALQSQFADLEDQIDIIEEDIGGLRTRLDTLEALSGRISALETQTETLETTLTETQQELSAAASQLDSVAEQMGIVNEEIEKIKEANSLFDSFLKGLQSLLNEALPLETSEGVQP